MNSIEILFKIRNIMTEKKVDIYIVRGTDQFLNEYVNLNKNPRYLISSFSGSAGEIIITSDKAFLIVDGRYHLQAENEVDKSLFQIIKIPLNETLDSRLKIELNNTIISIKKKKPENEKILVAFDSQRVSVSTTNQWISEFDFAFIDWMPLDNNWILDLTTLIPNKVPNLINVPLNISGLSSFNKLEIISNKLRENHFDIFLISSLDEISYLTNLRGKENAFSSTFNSYTFIWLLENKPKIILFTELYKLPKSLLKHKKNHIDTYDINDLFITINKLLSKCQNKNPIRVGFDPNSTNYFIYENLETIFSKYGKLFPKKSPIQEMKSIKNSSELNHLKYCFKRSDSVMRKAIIWIRNSLQNKIPISEKDIYDKINLLFFQSGAIDLSFEIISSSGKNTAIVHYTNPDPKKIICPDDLILLDIGGIYEGGYSTDCTRTFFASPFLATPNKKQKYFFTLVLKSAISGLTSRFPKYSTSSYIDSIVRQVLYNNNLDYTHGTGHGIGINVHEFPPRIKPGGNDQLVSGMVFSIEPGLYFNNWGGIRFENVVYLVEDPSNSNWLKPELLTYAPVDTNLIEESMLSDDEINWLNNYIKISNNNSF